MKMVQWLSIAAMLGIWSIMRPPVAAEEAGLKVGLAKVVITPEEPVWLSGYSARKSPAQGKIHDLWAKAAAFEDAAGTRFVLVTLDLRSVNVHMTEYVAARVEKELHLPHGDLVINCSHTHCAPEIAAEREVFHQLSREEAGKLDRYIEKTNVKLFELVAAALKDLKPAKLSYGRSTAGFAINRRSSVGSGVTDHEVPVLRVVGEDGHLRGILFGYACHNTTLNFQEYCGDYAGFAQYELEARHPEAVALFVMGCGGDQNPAPRRSLELAKKHGRALADAVDEALAGKQQPIEGPLRVAYEVVTLELERLPSEETLREQAKEGLASPIGRKAAYLLGILDAGNEIPQTQRCPLHVANFGNDLLMVFISGETVVDYSLRCKADFAGPTVWVVGYCDDVFAYLPSRRVLIEGGYARQWFIK